MGSPLPFGTGKLGVTLALVGFLKSLCGLYLFSGHGYAGGLGLFLTALGVGVGDVDLRGVLSLYRKGVGRGGLDTGVSLCLGDSDVLVPVGLGLTDLTVAVLFGNALLRVVDGLGGCLFTESLDVAGLVTDVGHVHVDELEADLSELCLHVLADGNEEFVTVRVDLLDVHRGDHQTKLSEKDVGRDVLDVVDGESEKPLGGVCHAVRLRRDSDGEAARHVHTDVLLGKSVGKVALDRDRLEVKERIVLEHRPHEGGSSVDASGRRDRSALVLTCLTVDDHHLVGRTTAVALKNRRECHEYDGDNDKDQRKFHIQNV